LRSVLSPLYAMYTGSNTITTISSIFSFTNFTVGPVFCMRKGGGEGMREREKGRGEKEAGEEKEGKSS
jgi:hypothetical protein